MFGFGASSVPPTIFIRTIVYTGAIIDINVLNRCIKFMSFNNKHYMELPVINCVHGLWSIVLKTFSCFQQIYPMISAWSTFKRKSRNLC